MLSLIGTLPAPALSGPLAILIYVVLILLLVSALATVLLRETIYAMGAFAATMLLVAILYLTIAPFLLFAVQLLIFTTVSAALVVGLLRDTTGLGRTTVGPFTREWIIGAAVSGAVLALVAVVLAATSWPVRLGRQGVLIFVPDLATALTNAYVVGLATAIVALASAALGAGLILRSAPALPSSRGRGEKPTVVRRPR